MAQELTRFMMMHPLPKQERKEQFSFASLFAWSTSPILRVVPVYVAMLLLFFGGSLAYVSTTSESSNLLALMRQEEPSLYSKNVYSPHQQAQKDTELLVQHFQEVESVLQKATTTPLAPEMLNTDIAEKTDTLQTYIRRIEQSGNLEEAIEAGSKLENTLEAHRKIIEQLSEKNGFENDEAIREFMEQIEAESIETTQLRTSLAQQVETLEAEQRETYSAELQRQVDEILALLETTAATSTEDANGEENPLVAEATVLLEEAQEMSDRGKELIDEGAYQAAIEELLIALHTAKKAQTYLAAYAAVEIDQATTSATSTATSTATTTPESNEE